MMWCFQRCNGFVPSFCLQPATHCRRGISQAARLFHVSHHLRNEAPRVLEANMKPLAAAGYLVKEELAEVNKQIQKELDCCRISELRSASGYYFNVKGKLFRPMIALLMSYACNQTKSTDSKTISHAQQIIAMVSEMLHCATLIHDDVIDLASTRRGQPVLHHMWGHKNAVLVGNFIFARLSVCLSRVNNPAVVELMTAILSSLVKGEILQLGTGRTTEERFTQYLEKSFKKTGSLLAQSCKSVAVLAQCDKSLCEAAFQYGRNIGIAFQLIDDTLDFVSTSQVLGKPAAVDIKLGLATGPVLFASETYPELEIMIMRRFTHKGDVDLALQLVKSSDGIHKTLALAQQFGEAAVKNVRNLPESPERSALESIVGAVLQRNT